MPDGPSFRQRVLGGEPLVGTFLNLGSPAAAEVCAAAGLDWVLIDLEHGASGDADLLAMLQAVSGSRAVPIVRVEQGTRLRIGRVLDLGADGVMVPRVESVAEAQEIGGWLRYPPSGTRGVALFTRGLGYGVGGHGSVAMRNEEIVGILQVEGPDALAVADELAALDAVDVLFIGPADLTHALGSPGRIDHPGYVQAVETVGRAARAHGKAAGVLLWQPQDVDTYLDAGFSFFSLSSEGALLQAAVRSGSAAIRERLAAAK